MRLLLTAMLALTPVAATIAAEPATAAPSAAEAFTAMPLGASMTWGTGSSTGNGYRENLRLRLAESGFSVDYVGSLQSGSMADRDNEGHSGFRIDQVAAGVEGWLATYQPEVVLLNAGTNDTRQNYDLPNAPARLHSLIERIVAARPDSTIVFSTLMPSPNSDNNTEVNAFNAELPAIAQEEAAQGHHVYLADLNSAVTIDDIGPDGIHPTDSGYVKIANTWNSTLLPILQAGA